MIILRVDVTYTHARIYMYADKLFSFFKIYITKKSTYCLMSCLFFNKRFTQINKFHSKHKLWVKLNDMGPKTPP